MVSVVRMTATGEGESNDREGLARPLTTAINGVVGSGVGQLLAGFGGVSSEGVAAGGGAADNAGGVLAGFRGYLR